jgi:hypothetical protein
VHFLGAQRPVGLATFRNFAAEKPKVAEPLVEAVGNAVVLH